MIVNDWLLNGMERFLSRSTRSTHRRRKGSAAAAAVQILEQRMLLSATVPMESDFNPDTTPFLASTLISNLNSSIPFSTTGYGGPTGDVAGGMVGQTYNQSIFVGHLPGQQYNISVASGWNLPPGLQLQDASGVPATDGILTGVSRFRIASMAGASPTAPGQYNVAFLATSTANSAISDTVVYHFLIRPSASVFQGSVTTTMPAPAGDATALGFNSLVLPPGTVGLPYNATIKVTNGSIGSVALMTQLSGGNLASAVNLQQPVPGLIGGKGGNVIGVNQATGSMLQDVIANVAGLKIKWSAKTSTISISGIPTISVGGVNDPLLLKVTGPNNQTLYYNFALTHSPAQIAKAYGFSSVVLAGGIKGTGAGQTVAIFAIGDNSAAEFGSKSIAIKIRDPSGSSSSRSNSRLVGGEGDSSEPIPSRIGAATANAIARKIQRRSRTFNRSSNVTEELTRHLPGKSGQAPAEFGAKSPPHQEPRQS